MVTGRDIGGTVYSASERRQFDRRLTRKPSIDPTLPVSDVGEDCSGKGIPYWPGYSEILGASPLAFCSCPILNTPAAPAVRTFCQV